MNLESLFMELNRLKARLEGLERKQPEVPLGLSLVSSQTLSGSVTTVTFSTIPQGFRHLRLICQIRTDVAAENDGILLRFNGDTAGNYDWSRLNIIGTAVTATVARAATSIQVGLGEGANSRASNFSPTLAHIFGYTRTDNEKWVLSQNTAFGDVSADGDLILQERSGRWRSATAVSSITLLPLTGTNFVSGSRFDLYGVR